LLASAPGAGGILPRPLAGKDPPCPRCGSQEVVLKNTFGATLCKMLYQCAACGEVFEAFKTV
ncbi:PaaD-like zinc ribbon domain-containing protein, partial [Thermus scotoductus]|uniref:PaaD-like zinc ribbon domain-containing protein n=1 Tax=Thermus scotoductus TaxID=37636 RepID=UPI00100250CE